MDIYQSRRRSYHDYWNARPTAQIKKELASWRKYIDSHSGAYDWHGKGITPSGCLADGDKVEILRNLLKDRGIET